jgi:hypothetical protein
MSTTIFSRQLHIIWEEVETSVSKLNFTKFVLNGFEKPVLLGLHSCIQECSPDILYLSLHSSIQHQNSIPYVVEVKLSFGTHAIKILKH